MRDEGVVRDSISFSYIMEHLSTYLSIHLYDMYISVCVCACQASIRALAAKKHSVVQMKVRVRLRF